MRYIKTYESFKTNETMDMFTLPVDPVAAGANVYGEIYEYIKDKLKDFANFLGDKFNLFKKKLEELVEKILEVAGNKTQEIVDRILQTFKIQTTVDTDMSFESIKKAVSVKYGREIESALKSNEELTHMEQEAGEDNATTSMPKESGLAQRILAILQNIFGFNLHACFVPLAALLALIAGLGAVSGMIVSIIITFIALVIITLLRKAVYKVEFGK